MLNEMGAVKNRASASERRRAINVQHRACSTSKACCAGLAPAAVKEASNHPVAVTRSSEQSLLRQYK